MKKCLKKKSEISRLCVYLAFWIIRTKCMQDKNGPAMRKIVLQGKSVPGFIEIPVNIRLL